MSDIRKIDWNERTEGYLDEMSNPYHAHRRKVLEAMIPESALQPDSRIFDFGCGDGSFLPLFLDAGATVAGCDVAPGMIEVARERLGKRYSFDGGLLAIGGVERLADLQDDSLDGMMALNVLAYLSSEEEHQFYEQARRTIRGEGGCWLPTPTRYSICSR